MKKIILVSLFLMFNVDILAAEENFESNLVSYKDCKATLDGEAPTFRLDATTGEKLAYEKAQICNAWALATFIALQASKSICSDTTYAVMNRAVSLAYNELPYEAGEEMVWSFAQVAMSLYPCSEDQE